MGYTTPGQVKRELSQGYQKPASKKLTEDGYIDVAGNFDETTFLNYFITQTAAFIDDYLSSVATPPFSANGVLDKINKILAVYEIELYLVSATQDRRVSVTLYANYQYAMKMLDKILNGDITITPSDEATYQGTVRLIQPDDDGDPLSLGVLEQDILLGDVIEEV